MCISLEFPLPHSSWPYPWPAYAVVRILLPGCHLRLIFSSACVYWASDNFLFDRTYLYWSRGWLLGCLSDDDISLDCTRMRWLVLMSVRHWCPSSSRRDSCTPSSSFSLSSFLLALEASDEDLVAFYDRNLDNGNWVVVNLKSIPGGAMAGRVWKIRKCFVIFKKLQS